MDNLNSSNVEHTQTMELSRFVTDLTMFYSIFNNNVECNILKGFKLPAYLLTLHGHSLRLFNPYCKSSIRKNFITHRVIPIWNVLPNIILNSNVFAGVKNRLQCLD